MPLNVSGGDAIKKTLRQTWSQFVQAETPFKSKFNAMTNPQKATALSEITNWQFAAGSPTVARENALYLAVALLYIAVGFLAREVYRSLT